MRLPPFLCLALVVAVLAPLRAELKLPAVIGDHMVLQAGEKIPVWGWARPGQAVNIALQNDQGETIVGGNATVSPDGKWRVELPKAPSGTAGRLVIDAGPDGKKEIADVLVGEVWICGGQSNMSYQVRGLNVTEQTVTEAKDMAAAAQGQIRYFLTSRDEDHPAGDDVTGEWKVAAPDNIEKCSAVAFYFAVALRQQLHRPIGLLISAVGGTPAEAWMPRDALDATSVAPAIWKRHQDNVASVTPEAIAAYEKTLADWKKAPEAARGLRPKDLYGPRHNYVPTRLYTNMIAGLGDYAARGIIWFQADGNIRNPGEYGELIQALIKSWRQQWHAELPFYYVEMNDMRTPQQKPLEEKVALSVIREQQQAALQLPRTGVVSSIDLGDIGNPTYNAHFPVKKPVGDRLAGLALKEVYGQKTGEVYSPEYASLSRDGDKLRVKLKHAEGLKARDGAVKGFILQKPDDTWVWAEGRIDGEDVLVWSPEAPQPKMVAYAWAENPVISLENAAGLPLRPFRAGVK